VTGLSSGAAAHGGGRVQLHEEEAGNRQGCREGDIPQNRLEKVHAAIWAWHVILLGGSRLPLVAVKPVDHVGQGNEEEG